MEIKTLVTKAHENAVKHGFWEPPLSLIHISEPTRLID